MVFVRVGRDDAAGVAFDNEKENIRWKTGSGEPIFIAVSYYFLMTIFIT
jgi:hypothetical protein